VQVAAVATCTLALCACADSANEGSGAAGHASLAHAADRQAARARNAPQPPTFGELKAIYRQVCLDTSPGFTGAPDRLTRLGFKRSTASGEWQLPEQDLSAVVKHEPGASSCDVAVNNVYRPRGSVLDDFESFILAFDPRLLRTGGPARPRPSTGTFYYYIGEPNDLAFGIAISNDSPVTKLYATSFN
jgi:hypothetical protein